MCEHSFNYAYGFKRIEYGGKELKTVLVSTGDGGKGTGSMFLYEKVCILADMQTD
jgi:hypothetical protein